MKASEAPESYPVQFKDKIDEYLWKEHHILGGCCSSIESLKYSVAREVAEKLTDAIIEKVCNLLSRMVWEVTYEDLEGDSVEHYDKTEFIEEIRKYLESKV